MWCPDRPKVVSLFSALMMASRDTIVIVMDTIMQSLRKSSVPPLLRRPLTPPSHGFAGAALDTLASLIFSVAGSAIWCYFGVSVLVVFYLCIFVVYRMCPNTVRRTDLATLSAL